MAIPFTSMLCYCDLCVKDHITLPWKDSSFPQQEGSESIREQKEPSMRKPKLTDVAREAGLSTKAASQALQHGRGAAETVARVREVAVRLGYKVRRGKSARQGILLVTPMDLNPFYFAELAASVLEVLLGAGYELIHEDSGDDVSKELRAIDRAMTSRLAGVVLVSPRSLPRALENLGRARIPSVAIGARLQDLPEGAAAVNIDNFAGTAEAVDHLRSLGHKRIAYLRGRGASFSDQERFRGFQEQMRRTGAHIEDRYVVELTEHLPAFRAGADACRGLLRLPQHPTAIIAYNDAMAMGCLAAAAEEKVAVPEELSVIGHDDLPFTPYTIPPLSTVAIDRRRLGRLAAEQLIKLMDGEATQRTVMETYFRVRRSTAVARVDQPPDLKKARPLSPPL